MFYRPSTGVSSPREIEVSVVDGCQAVASTHVRGHGDRGVVPLVQQGVIADKEWLLH